MNGILTCVVFCEWLPSLGAMFLRFIPLVSISISFLFMAREYSFVQIYPITLIHLSIDGYLGCFHLLVSVNNTAVNITGQVSVWANVFFFLKCALGFKFSYC